MRGIFISYRREDAEGQAGRLFDDLANEFGNAAVFMDVAGIEPGRDFRRAIDENVANCGVLLAIIGKNWLNIRDAEGQRRIDDPMDFVRLETAAALKRDIPVIPVLVQGAKMPRTAHLPPDLVDIAFRNGVELTHARWDSDVQILFKALRPHVQAAGAAGSSATPPRADRRGGASSRPEPAPEFNDDWSPRRGAGRNYAGARRLCVAFTKVRYPRCRRGERHGQPSCGGAKSQC